MANKTHPLAISTISGTASGFFMFITGATTVSGMFLALFGLSSFGFILTGDQNITMWTVLHGLSMLPNPLEFIQDCNKILLEFSPLVSQLSALSAGTGNLLLDILVNIALVLVRILQYAFAFTVSCVLLPFYLIWFFVRCLACFFIAIGMKWEGLNQLTVPWQPIGTLLDIIKGGVQS